MRQELLQEIRLAGAQRYLEKMQENIRELYQEFGRDLFPNGMPFIFGPERRPVKNAQAAAKRLIEEAERLRGKHERPKAKRRGRKRFVSDPGSPTVSIAEAANIIGVTPTTLRSWIRTERVPLAPERDEKNMMTLPRSAVETIRDSYQQRS